MIGFTRADDRHRVASIPNGGGPKIAVFGYDRSVYGVPTVRFDGIDAGDFLTPAQACAVADGLRKAAFAAMSGKKSA